MRRFKATTHPCPEYFGAIAQRQWEYLVSALSDMGLLHRADRGIMEMYCISYARWRMALDALTMHGEVREDGRANAYGAVVRDCMATMFKCVNGMGLSPGARSRMSVKDDQPTGEDPLNEFLE